MMNSVHENSVHQDFTETKEMEAKNAVKNHILWALGVGIVPVPIVDIVGITGIQLKMLASLSKIYNVPFSENRIKSLVAALFAGVGSTNLAIGALGSLLKSVPVVGHYLGMTSVPVMAGAFTYATGKVFIQHFESGGTFLDFDPQKVKRYFAEQFEKGKKVAKDLKV